MDTILTDSHPDTRIKGYILMNVIVLKLGYYAGDVWEGNAKLVKQLETVQTTVAKEILRFLYFIFLLIPFIIFAQLLLSLLPTRNSDPGSHSRLC